jgi:hypothetical protein
MIKHILKDGTTTTDISGHMVTREQCPSAYAVMATIRKEKQYGTDNNSSSEIRELQASKTVQSTTLGTVNRRHSDL